MAGQWLNALMQAPDAGQSFTQAYQQARQAKQQDEIRRQQMEEHREDRQLQMQDRQQAQRKQQLEQAREQIGIMGRLLDGVNDPVSYERARQAAASMPGWDLSGIPPTYDPNWIAQQKMQAQALAGKLDQELMAVAPGTSVIDKRTGRPVYTNPRGPRYIPVPPGGKLVLDPSTGGSYDAGNDDEWETIGGPSSQGSGGFL